MPCLHDEIFPAGNDGRYVIWKCTHVSDGLVIPAESLTDRASFIRGDSRWHFIVPPHITRVSYERVDDLSKLERWRRRDPYWQREGVRIFVTCVSCGHVNDISHNSISPTGHVFECGVCHRCRVHTFASLVGFTRADHAKIRPGTRANDP